MPNSLTPRAEITTYLLELAPLMRLPLRDYRSPGDFLAALGWLWVIDFPSGISHPVEEGD